jgi:phosphoribosyl 1,2-cyclic phosphodiesterase
VDESKFEIGDVKIQSSFVSHPGPTLGYRLSAGNAVLAYIPDHELPLGSSNFPREPDWTSGFEIAKDADLLFHDAEYTEAEYATKIGWGHSSMEDAIDLGKLCRVKKLALFHHDPMNSDLKLESMFRECIRNLSLDFEVELCAEGNSYEL